MIVNGRYMDPSIRDVIANAIRYWERGRILYNAVLAAIVIGYFVANWPVSGVRFSFDLAQFLFVLAVLANIAYCAAYPVDVFVQMSSVRTAWLREVVRRLNEALNQTLETTSIKQRFADLSMPTKIMTPEETKSFVENEEKLWWPMVRELEPK